MRRLDADLVLWLGPVVAFVGYAVFLCVTK